MNQEDEAGDVLEANGDAETNQGKFCSSTTMLMKTCAECGEQCHIRCKKCTKCSAEFVPRNKLPLPPSKLQRKYPSNLWKIMMMKAEQLHYNNCDVVILMHKRNAKKRSWHSYGTPGAGANFLITHSEKINKLWQENIYNFEDEISQGATDATSMSDSLVTTISNDSESNSSIPTPESNNSIPTLISNCNDFISILESNISTLAPNDSIPTSDHDSIPISVSYDSIQTLESNNSVSTLAPNDSIPISVSNDSIQTLESNNSVSTLAPDDSIPTSDHAKSVSNDSMQTLESDDSMQTSESNDSIISNDSATLMSNDLMTSLSSDSATTVSNYSGTVVTKDSATLTSNSLATLVFSGSVTPMSNNSGKKRNRKRCKRCEGCLTPKCNNCVFCLNPKYKKPCVKRICSNLHY